MSQNKRALAKIDKQIAAIYLRNCSGVQINVMDIGKIYAAGRSAAAAGGDLEAAVMAAVAALRQN